MVQQSSAEALGGKKPAEIKFEEMEDMVVRKHKIYIQVVNSIIDNKEIDKETCCDCGRA